MNTVQHRMQQISAGVYDSLKLSVLKVLVAVDAVIRFVRPEASVVLKSLEAGQSPDDGKTLCIFAHFDRDGIVDDYVLYYLEQLALAGCVTVFVSTAEDLDDASIRKIRPFCTRIIVKRNIGYDFGSWKAGLAAAGDTTRYERIVIANDSVYGPITDLRAVFAEMAARDVAFWGITDSLRYTRHLQSYFLVFELPVLEGEEFWRFWRALPDYRSKHVVIVQCEIGLTKTLVGAGYRFAAYCPFESVMRATGRSMSGLAKLVRGARINPTHWGWRTLIQKASCPFVKVQLLRDNPNSVPDAGEWEPAVRSVSDYDAALIRRHLERMRSVSGPEASG